MSISSSSPIDHHEDDRISHRNYGAGGGEDFADDAIYEDDYDDDYEDDEEYFLGDNDEYDSPYSEYEEMGDEWLEDSYRQEMGYKSSYEKYGW